jgi:hypothetical protein
MTRRIVIGLGLATIVVCMWLWQATASKPAAASESIANASTNPPGIASRTAPPPSLSTPPVVTEDLAAALDDARRHVIAAARPCWTPSKADAPSTTPDDTIGKLDLRYDLVSDGGEAHLEAVRIKRSTIQNHSLQACIEQAVAGARWPSSAASGRLPIRDTLAVGELTRREPPALP